MVSNKYNRSRTGRVLINFALPQVGTQAPSSRYLLRAPLVLSDRQVHESTNGTVVFDVSSYHISLPAGGLFIIAEGVPNLPYVSLGDTLIRGPKNAPIPSKYIKLAILGSGSTAHRIVNATDFICLREMRTTNEPQTWDYSTQKPHWVKRRMFYANCLSCIISNTAIDLLVQEL